MKTDGEKPAPFSLIACSSPPSKIYRLYYQPDPMVMVGLGPHHDFIYFFTGENKKKETRKFKRASPSCFLLSSRNLSFFLTKTNKNLLLLTYAGVGGALSTSSSSKMMMRLVIMCILWHLSKNLFLGNLHYAEVKLLRHHLFFGLLHFLFPICIFTHDLPFLLFPAHLAHYATHVTAFLLLKSLHLLALKRLHFIQSAPFAPKLSHFRIVTFFAFLLALDHPLFFYSFEFAAHIMPSLSLFFALQYLILATTTVSALLKHVLFVIDVMVMEGHWERKHVYTFYVELILDLLLFAVYLCFFIFVFMHYDLRMYWCYALLRICWNIRIRVRYYYRKITSDMTDRFPDATPQQLSRLSVGDGTCIICHDRMTTAKKLLCGHLFHLACLRPWLERQRTCPTCRASVIPSDDRSDTARLQSGSHPDAHQQGAAQGS